MLNESFSTIWKDAHAKRLTMRTCQLCLPMTINESFEAKQRCTLPAAGRWTVKCSGRKHLRLTLAGILCPTNTQLGTMCGGVF